MGAMATHHGSLGRIELGI